MQKRKFREKIRARLIKFKKFLKKNMTKTWAAHFSYQVLSFILSVVLVIGVANYAIIKSYEERTLRFVDGFTITAHSGSFDTKENSLDSIKEAIAHNADVVEMDVRQRPDGTLVMAHDFVVKNGDGVPLEEGFKILATSTIEINLDIKETRTLAKLNKMLKKYNLVSRAVMTGLFPKDTAEAQKNCPDVPYYINYFPSRVKIFSVDYQQKLMDILNECGAIGINCNYKYASEKLSKVLHKNGYKLSVWTVNSEFSMKKVLALKADNITTKKQEKLLQVIDSWKKKA